LVDSFAQLSSLLSILVAHLVSSELSMDQVESDQSVVSILTSVSSINRRIEVCQCHQTRSLVTLKLAPNSSVAQLS
jgi:hypothetical protein